MAADWYSPIVFCTDLGPGIAEYLRGTFIEHGYAAGELQCFDRIHWECEIRSVDASMKAIFYLGMVHDQGSPTDPHTLWSAWIVGGGGGLIEAMKGNGPRFRAFGREVCLDLHRTLNGSPGITVIPQPTGHPTR